MAGKSTRTTTRKSKVNLSVKPEVPTRRSRKRMPKPKGWAWVPFFSVAAVAITSIVGIACNGYLQHKSNEQLNKNNERAAILEANKLILAKAPEARQDLDNLAAKVRYAKTSVNNGIANGENWRKIFEDVNGASSRFQTHLGANAPLANFIVHKMIRRCEKSRDQQVKVLDKHIEDRIDSLIELFNQQFSPKEISAL